MAALDERLGVLIELAKVVGSEMLVRLPFEAEPAHGFLDGVDVFLLFLRRIGVVEAKVTAPAVLLGQAEVEADRLGMAEMQVSVRLRRKARDDFLVPARRQVGLDDLADEIARGRKSRFVHTRILNGKPLNSRWNRQKGNLSVAATVTRGQ